MHFRPLEKSHNALHLETGSSKKLQGDLIELSQHMMIGS